MKIEAHRLSGLGNIILIVDQIRQAVSIEKKEIIRLVSEGINDFDQIITIEPPEQKDIDLRARIFNVDGSEAMNCINGARCLAKYVFDSNLLPQKEFTVSTKGGIWRIKKKKTENYEVLISTPDFNTEEENITASEPGKVNTLMIEGNEIEFYFVNLGNPHAVCLVDDIEQFPLSAIGAKIQDHPFFPDGVNLGIAKITSRDSLDLRVFERGAGETMACGSGACAAVVIGKHVDLLNNKVQVNFKNGSLEIDYDKNLGKLIASGEANYLNKETLEL
jgi:diaminopimelate epimerase